MQLPEFLEKYPTLKKYLIPLVLASLGMICFVYGLISLFGATQKKEDITFQDISSQTSASASAKQNKKEIAVDIEGAVIKQGLYHLGSDARVQDGLIAAGGLSQQADRQWVEKKLNLAAKLPDGAKLYIPRQGETTAPMLSQEFSSGNASVDAASVLNINEASLDALDGLSGVGKVTAQKIIDNRPYQDINDLVTKKIVSKKMFEVIKDKIAVY